MSANLSHLSFIFNCYTSAAATDLAAVACISTFNYTDLQAYINYISFTFHFYKATSFNFNCACKERRWTWKREEN